MMNAKLLTLYVLVFIYCSATAWWDSFLEQNVSIFMGGKMMKDMEVSSFSTFLLQIMIQPATDFHHGRGVLTMEPGRQESNLLTGYYLTASRLVSPMKWFQKGMH